MPNIVTNAGFTGWLIAALSVFLLLLSIISIRLSQSRRVALFFCRFSPLPLIIGLVASFYATQMSQINRIEFSDQGMTEQEIHVLELKNNEQAKAATHIGLAGTLIVLAASGFLAMRTPKKPS